MAERKLRVRRKDPEQTGRELEFNHNNKILQVLVG